MGSIVALSILGIILVLMYGTLAVLKQMHEEREERKKAQNKK